MEPTHAVEVDTEGLGSHDDVSEEKLRDLVDLLSPDNSFLIVHRSDLPNEVYAQAALERDATGRLVGGGFLVEHRDGPHSHWQAKVSEKRVVAEVLSGWALGREGWKDLVAWRRLELGF